MEDDTSPAAGGLNESPGATTGSGDPENPQHQLAAQFKREDAAAAAYWHELGWKGLKQTREYARGKTEAVEDGKPGLVRVNVAHATIKALVPHVYSRNPDIAVSPTEGVDQSELAAVKMLTKTLQTVLGHEFVRRGELKGLAKRCLRGTLTSAVSWAKVSYQREWGQDPIAAARLKDAQDDLARIDAHMRALQSDTLRNESDVAAKREELRNTITAVQQQVQVIVQQGINLSRVAPEHLILDPSIPELELYGSGRFMTEIIWKPLSAAREWFDDELKDAKLYGWHQADESQPAQGTDQAAAGKTHDPMVKIYERWNGDTSTVYHRIEGIEGFVREPWAPDTLGERWYPYFGLWFDETDGYKWPLSLIELLKELIDEYNSSRTQRADHREISIPHWIAAKDADRNSLERYRDALLGEVVLVDTGGRPLREVLEVAVPPPFNPQLYDTTDIRADFDMMSGLQDANRAGIVQAKTATEAEILQQGLSSRAAEIQDRIEDWIDAMATYAGEILFQELDLAEVQRIAGPSAVWPELDKDAIFEKVTIEIRAGSSGKPDKRHEQETWTTLLPVLLQLRQLITQTMVAGMDPSPLVEIARETLNRFDDSLDVEAFFPEAALIGQMGGQGGLPGLPGMPGAQPGLPAPGGGAPGNVVPFPPAGAAGATGA